VAILTSRFVVEAVMIAAYGALINHKEAVDFVIPYSSLSELYELDQSKEPIMDDQIEEKFVREYIKELIAFFESPMNSKKVQKSLIMPWASSAPILLDEHTNVQFTIVHAMDNAQYGELFDPVETEMILTAMRQQIPILSDQLDFIARLIEADVPVKVYDVEDFEFALEEGTVTTPGLLDQ
jgi:hypothetical protein